MKQSTRLIVNSAATFGRMAITIGISLAVTRLLLRTLGDVDFGLIIALGATGALLQVVTSGLSSSVQRQFSYALGQKDIRRLHQVFSTAWGVFALLAAALWLLGQLIAPLILHGLTIPPDRTDAAWWVYQITLLSLVLAVTAAPYQALIVAHQHVFINAIADTFSALIRLASVLTITVAPWDRMVTYVALQLAGAAVVRWSLTAYCLWRFEGSRPRPRDFDAAELKEIFSIAGWTLVGDLSWRMRMQGGTLLINVFFGPVINASYGIAIQVVGYVMNVAQAMRLAVLPAIIGAEAKGNRHNVHRLALSAGKYVVLLLSLLFVPLWLEADQVLRLWLGDLPPMTILLTRIALVWALAYVFNIGQRMALLATGNLGWYGKLTIVLSVCVLVVAGTLFMLGLGPWALPAVEVLSVLCLISIEALVIGHEIGMPISRWFREAIGPTLAVLIPATTAAITVHLSMEVHILRLAAVTATYAAVALPLIWFVSLATWERDRFRSFAGSAWARLAN